MATALLDISRAAPFPIQNRRTAMDTTTTPDTSSGTALRALLDDAMASEKALRRARFLGALNDGGASVYHEDNASEFVASLIDSIVAKLRRDRRWARIPRAELEKLLDDVRCRFEEDLAEDLTGCAPLDGVLKHAVAAWDMAEDPITHKPSPCRA
jgi:hypothetical protein